MKKLMNLSFVLNLIILAFSCQQGTIQSEQKCCLTSEDSMTIVNEITAVINDWIQANKNRDIEKCTAFWDSSPDFMLAENGMQYANWDSLYVVIKEWYSQPLESIEFDIEKRSILPLTPEVAHIFCKMSFRTNFSSGDVFQSRGFLTLLAVKKDGNWKMLRGHESTIITGND
jgi:ketosteroid isomerase-like protein